MQSAMGTPRPYMTRDCSVAIYAGARPSCLHLPQQRSEVLSPVIFEVDYNTPIFTGGVDDINSRRNTLREWPRPEALTHMMRDVAQITTFTCSSPLATVRYVLRCDVTCSDQYLMSDIVRDIKSYRRERGRSLVITCIFGLLQRQIVIQLIVVSRSRSRKQSLTEPITPPLPLVFSKMNHPVVPVNSVIQFCDDTHGTSTEIVTSSIEFLKIKSITSVC